MTMYDEALRVCKDYMGPTAARFLDRQINSHLGIEPHQLSGYHIEELANWCYTSGKLLMREERAKEFSQKVRALTR